MYFPGDEVIFEKKVPECNCEKVHSGDNRLVIGNHYIVSIFGMAECTRCTTNYLAVGIVGQPQEIPFPAIWFRKLRFDNEPVIISEKIPELV